MMKLISSVAIMMIGGCIGVARAGDYPFLDELTRYAERIDTLSVTSGDAKDVNAAIQTIDPWPPNSRNRNIPANGQRMVGAVNRYQNPKLLGAQSPTLAPIITQSLSGGGGADQGSVGIGGGGGQ